MTEAVAVAATDIIEVDEDVDIAINRTTIDPATTTTITMEAEEVDVREIDSEPKH